MYYHNTVCARLKKLYGQTKLPNIGIALDVWFIFTFAIDVILTNEFVHILFRGCIEEVPESFNNSLGWNLNASEVNLRHNMK